MSNGRKSDWRLDPAGSLGARIRAILASLSARPVGPDARTSNSHAISGLPTREPLIARMAADERGTIALVTCKDYDRLCAFDPQLGERVLLTLIDRLVAMLPPTRLVAHVDRGHLAVWAGPDALAVDAELDALVYALGDRVIDGAREILPEIVLRKTRFDAAAATPQVALSRTLASFAVPASAAGVQQLDSQAFARERFLIEQDLRQAVARGELRLHFQPLVDAANARVCGAEALIRWQHRVRGLVPPSRFVPVMEAAGLSQEIGLWTLNAAIREARGWRKAGLGPLRVAVNVSGHQLDVPDLHLLVERTLARHSVGADALEIELTESVAMGDGDRAARLFDALRALGIRIAIDDFGTGYSSFSTLRTLAFDKIKIDREFVTSVHTRRDSQAICNSILALGRGLGIRVLAEGVEDAAEYGWLRRQGCQHFQGFHFAPPLQGPEFIAFVRDGEGWRDARVRSRQCCAARYRKAACMIFRRFHRGRGAGPDAGPHAGRVLGRAEGRDRRAATRAAAVSDVDAILALLDQGDAKGAKKRIAGALKRDPMNASLLMLRDSIDGDARDQLGAASYPHTVGVGETMTILAQRFLGNRLKAYQLARYTVSSVRRRWSRGRCCASRTLPRAEPPRRVEARPTPTAPRAKPAAIAAPAAKAPAANPVAAQRARAAGLAALNQGKVGNAVAMLRRAQTLDPGNAVIARDLTRGTAHRHHRPCAAVTRC